MAIHMFSARSDEWLAFRQKRISATEAASLVGVNSYLTANKLLEQKRGGDLDKIENQHIWDGYIAEPGVFKFLELMGWDLDPLAPKGKVLVFTNTDENICSTPDNFRWDDPAVVEAKKTTKANFEKNWLGSCPPLRYLSQVQLQMYTTGFTKGYLVCTHFEDHIPISIYEVALSRDFIELVESQVGDFNFADSRFEVSKDVKDMAAEYLKKSYKWLGIYRQGKQQTHYTTESLSEIFRDGF